MASDERSRDKFRSRPGIDFRMGTSSGNGRSRSCRCHGVRLHIIRIVVLLCDTTQKAEGEDKLQRLQTRFPPGGGDDQDRYAVVSYERPRLRDGKLCQWRAGGLFHNGSFVFQGAADRRKRGQCFGSGRSAYHELQFRSKGLRKAASGLQAGNNICGADNGDWNSLHTAVSGSYT